MDTNTRTPVIPVDPKLIHTRLNHELAIRTALHPIPCVEIDWAVESSSRCSLIVEHTDGEIQTVDTMYWITAVAKVLSGNEHRMLKLHFANIDNRARVVEARDRELAEVRARYAPHIDRADYIFSMVASAREEIDRRKAGHPWEGREVRRLDHRSKAFIYGIVEVRRDQPRSSYSALRRSWAVPDVGKAYVRLFRKDGTPSRAVDIWMDEWQLVEEQDAHA